MKKYRLKQWYPSLGGDFKNGEKIIFWEERGCYVKNFGDDISLRKTEVENNPDFWELTTDQINNTTKDEYIERKIEDIKKSIKKYGYDKISTCNSFSYGWSKEDYLYMDDVASKLRQIGVTVRKEMKFGVMDYYFT